MIPRNDAERLVATALADALRGRLALGPLDIARLAVAAKQVPAQRVAMLALRQWITIDPNAIRTLEELNKSFRSNAGRF